MTNREFLEIVKNANLGEEITEHAERELTKLDERNAKRANTQSKTQKENEVVKTSILELFGENDTKVASEVATALEISTQKASSLLRQLVESGNLKVEDIKVPKKGKVKSYSLV